MFLRGEDEPLTPRLTESNSYIYPPKNGFICPRGHSLRQSNGSSSAADLTNTRNKILHVFDDALLVKKHCSENVTFMCPLGFF